MRAVGTESRRAALRVLVVDGSITQIRASHWVPGSKTCSQHRLEDETVSHRLWSCPAWDKVRDQHRQGWTRGGLARLLSTHNTVSGVPAADPLFLAAREQAKLGARSSRSQLGLRGIAGQGIHREPPSCRRLAPMLHLYNFGACRFQLPDCSGRLPDFHGTLAFRLTAKVLGQVPILVKGNVGVRP
jgi:hypothetical protein